MKLKSTLFFVVLSTALFATPLAGQESAPDADAQLEELEQLEPDTEPAEEPLEDGETAENEQPPTDPAEAEDPLAEVDAAEEGEVAASMERFKPSEKISEDRSVAFPNDI